MTMELVVAVGLLTLVLIPISLSYAAEQRACRASYYRAVAMEIVDGEMEVLRAGEWKQFSEGRQSYVVSEKAAKNLPPGKFVLTRTANRLRLEWLPGARDQGGPVTREIAIP